MGIITKHGRTALSAIAGITMAASMTTGVALAEEPENTEVSPQGSESNEQGNIIETGLVAEPKVIGEFSYAQTVLTPNAEIAKFFQKATQAICGATIDLAIDNPLGWQLSVTGDVGKAFTASVGDLADEEAVKKVMTCTCGGNPVGGRAIITAEVKGIPVEHLLTRAEADPQANTVTFVSSDGTETAFPLSYLIGRHAVISYEINDEDLSASVGGNNQLWMMKTPANYFVRDIVSVVVSTEDVVPADPGTTDEHPNSPNIGVLKATQD